ncbi:MAG: hypothetical protein GXO77_11145 [Calditrichaeota bacterium]|nr:hypothetical protein [Calditrichota bacterium]
MKTILIRAEDKNIWERRTPIVPEDLKTILETVQTKAFIEKSDKRFFKEQEYTSVGARVCEGMQEGDIILGVKEIPVEKLLEQKVYLFFSHTIKGQKANMPMLQKIIDGKSTLIDYEKITDDSGRRLVFFGRFAGDAGAIDILWLMGENWKHRGLKTPFEKCKQALHYHSVKEAHQHLQEIGKEIKEKGLPESLQPLVIGILGYGNVSKGAQYIFDALPVKRIEPDELPALFESRNFDPKTIYLTIFKEEHLVAHKSGQKFNLSDYYQRPENYKSIFSNYLPYLSILVNAIYWDERYPRFVTWDDLQKSESEGKLRLQGIADITCDVNGSIECNVKATDSGQPAYRVLPLRREISDGHLGEGIVLLAVDNLPAELPNDSSRFFSRQLSPFIPAIIQSDFEKPLDQSGLPPEIKRAVIVYNGELTPDFRYLENYLK